MLTVIKMGPLPILSILISVIIMSGTRRTIAMAVLSLVSLEAVPDNSQKLEKLFRLVQLVLLVEVQKLASSFRADLRIQVGNRLA